MGINAMKIVPADDTIADLKKKATEYEEQAAKQHGTIAALLKEKAKLCREWIAALKSGKWMSLKQ
jgi:hypothetical protein